MPIQDWTTCLLWWKNRFEIVLCEYSNWIVTSVFDSKRAQLFEIHKGVQENDVSVKMCLCSVLLLTMVQVLYLLEVFILAHYGPPSTETPTTETSTVQCRKNSWISLTSTYYWWLLRPTVTIRFDSKWKHTIHTAPVWHRPHRGDVGVYRRSRGMSRKGRGKWQKAQSAQWTPSGTAAQFWSVQEQRLSC